MRLTWICCLLIVGLVVVKAAVILSLINAVAWLAVVAGGVAIAWKFAQYFTRR